MNQSMNGYYEKDYTTMGAVSTPTTLQKLDTFYSHPIVRVARMVATGAQVYHGYKRNGNSIGWAIGWFFLPVVIGLPLMLAQGFGKRA